MAGGFRGLFTKMGLIVMLIAFLWIFGAGNFIFSNPAILIFVGLIFFALWSSGGK